MLSSLEKNIKNKKLTKTEKKIAEFFLKNGPQITFMTSKDIANSLSISDTSVIRFVKALGYNNFGHFKEIVQNEVSKTVLTPTQKLNKNKDILKSEKILDSFIKNISRQIDEGFSEQSLNTISTICEILNSSKKKYIVGFKSISGVVSFLGLRLGFILKEVFTYSENSSELLKGIVDINEGDCLFLFAFPKYSKTLSLLLDIAKKAGAKVIVITDKSSSPVAYKGDITFFLDTLGISYFNSIIPAQIFVEFLLTNLSKSLSQESEERIKIINSYLDMNVK